jgi:hypothetical protein
MRSVFLSLLLALPTAGCVLPSYDKVPAHDAGSAASKASAGPGCGLPSKLSSACGKCLHDNCCDLAQTCADDKNCSKEMLKPITPVAQLSEAFDPLLQCMQSSCDDACQVSWSCVDHYTWPVPKDSYDVTVHVIDFAATPDKPLPGVTVDACQSVDPSCGTGKVTSDVTDENGDVTLTLAAGFDGFFAFSGGGYLPSTAQFSEPLYRSASFTQYGLTKDAIQVLALVTNVHKAGEQFDPSLGHVIFRTQNCLPLRFLQRDEPPHAEAGGVSVSIEPNAGASQIFYTDKSGGVSLSLDATTTNAFGGTFNLAANSHTLTGTEATTGRTIESGTMVIRAGTVGFMYLLPSATR